MKTLHLRKPDAHLHYHDLPGTAPALIMLHGLGSASSSWYPQAARHPHLRHHQCVLVDLLGFGFSDRPQAYTYSMESQAESVAALLDHLALSRTILIGHSMAGAIAILLAEARPDLVSHLVVAEGNLDSGPGFISSRIVSVSEDDFADRKHAVFVQQMHAAGYHDYAGSLRASDSRALHRSAVSLVAPRSPSYRDRLYQLKTARTFLFGERTLPHPDERALRDAGIDVRVVPAAGHDMMADNADGFAAVVAASIAERAVS